MLRGTTTSPGARPMTWLAGTGESEQPIHRYLGACSSDRRSKNCGSSLRTPSAQAWLLRSSFSSACFMESVLWAGEVHSADEHPRQPGDPRHKESGDDRPEEGGHDEAREWPPVADEVQHDRDQRRHDSQRVAHDAHRSEEHTSELQSLMRISYAVFCLKK